ncbi:ABC transporter permease [Maledivibacter halophilus]|uniref:Nucleoside ABC transporter membrane protein n=1 Tax=Maledivibacter halophilus TaxID=36842 RepID=A0A1T5M5P5_9FIRM|nr:ABC transporter permease [Maledivibacter halophilus]SKC83552.1 nucleoside ABC transporter membrane protein [Maledivibacter halophilus]
MTKNQYLNTLFTIIISLLVGGVVIIFMGFNPIEAYIQLFKGAFAGKFNFGGTLERFVPLLLTALAFAVSAKVAVFNVGVEGELYLGAIAAAWAGYSIVGLPKGVHIIICIGFAMVVGSLWAAIPGLLKAYYKVNEVCTTILLNYVAIFFTSYLVNNPLSAKTGVPQTPNMESTALLSKILKPSRANTGLFIAIAVLILVYWLVQHTTIGYKLRSVGLNPNYSDYMGFNAKRTMVIGMMMSGAIGGLAGAIEVMGIYGHFLDNFSPGIAFDGMLASLIARNNIKMIPVLALFLAVLKSGALGMERFTGVPKSLVDAIIAMFILLAAMEGLFMIKKWKKNKSSKIDAAKADI